MEEKNNWVKIGTADNMSVGWDKENSPNFHIALIGSSGSGKSVQAQKIICELAEKGGTALIIDQHGSFTDDQILGTYREVIDKRRNDIDAYDVGIPCRLFIPVRYPDGKFEHETDTVSAITDVLSRSLKLGSKQRATLRYAVQRVMREGTYKEAGFAAVGDALKENDDKVSLELLERMHHLFEHNIFRDEDGIILDNKINIVHLSKLALDTQETVAEMLLAYIWRLGNAEQFKNRDFYLFIDECQNMDTSSKGPLALMISEGRRMGINLILATQMILQGTTNAVQQRISQCGLILYFKPAANRVGLTAQLISTSNKIQWARTLNELKVGEFVAVGNLLLANRPIRYPLVVSAYEKPEAAEKKRNPIEVTRGMVGVSTVQKRV